MAEHGDEVRDAEEKVDIVEVGEDADAVADAPAGLVPGDEGEHDFELHEEILASDTAWSGKIFNVERMEVRLPSGRCSVRDVVRHPGAVAVVALTEMGKIALVRQYRTSLDRVTVEIPAGKLEPGEDPLEAARRELVEETGYAAGELTPLVSVAPAPGYTDEVVRVYLARDLAFTAQHTDGDEFLNVDLVPLGEVRSAVLSGAVIDAKTVAGILALGPEVQPDRPR